MNWKLGVLWGALLAVLQWLGWLGAQGGIGPWATEAMVFATALIFAYIGFTSFRLRGQLAYAAFTATLAGLIAGFFGSLPQFFNLQTSPIGATLVTIVLATASSGLWALVLGALGGFWARFSASGRQRGTR